MQAAASNWTMMASRQSENNAQEETSPLTTPNANIARIIPSLPLETRWPPFPLRRYANFWLPEVALKEGVPGVHSCFEPRPTDVFLASFPKSGTTWLKALAFATLKRSTHPPFDDDHPLRHCNPHDCVRFLELDFNQQKDELEALPSPRVLATHLPYSLLPGSITGDGERSGCRIVYVCREPKDVLVSSWLFTRKAAPACGVDARSFTIQEALELFCDGRCLGGPQWNHVLHYWKESVRRPDRVLFLRYEEVLIEPEAHVRKLANFMGCGFSEEEEERGVVSAIVELCSLGKLRDMEVNRNGSTLLGIKNESFFRKGVVGDWSKHMTQEMAQRLDKVVEDALQGTGFTFASTA
ncbi:Cytosolic sulfotransferase 17 [Zea mays]|uniref:Sulfotransferase n=1 Tax=Zea mays TaxID=4577 RepID=A0A1D6N1I0_MAIZE|nr:Cytosolic sulfotransferase 17 [Zea mays]